VGMPRFRCNVTEVVLRDENSSVLALRRSLIVIRRTSVPLEVPDNASVLGIRSGERLCSGRKTSCGSRLRRFVGGRFCGILGPGEGGWPQSWLSANPASRRALEPNRSIGLTVVREAPHMP